MRMLGRQQHWGGNRLGGGGLSVQCPEGGCLPCQGDAPLAKRHWLRLVCLRYGCLCWRCQIAVVG